MIKKEPINNKELIVLRNLKIILPKFLTAAVEKKKSMKYLEKNFHPSTINLKKEVKTESVFLYFKAVP